jgi:hypothetical protein
MAGRGLAGLALFAALAAGCGPQGNSLGGSISELFALQYSRVDILRNEHALQVSYLNSRRFDLDLVLRLTVALEGVTLQVGEPLALEGEYAPGHQRTTAVHLAAGEPTRTLPKVRRGELRLAEGGGAGEYTRGEFTLSFEQTDEYGGGRTVFGSFVGIAQDASLDP